MRTPKCALILLLLIPSCAQAQDPPQPANSLPFTLKPLGDNIYAAIDDAKGDAGANAGFVIGDDAVLVIDTFENPAAANALLAEIRKLSNLPIKFVVNTHYHIDHVSGNALFKQAGATVLAHRGVTQWIHSENLKFFGKDIKPKEKAMVENLAAPDVVYDNGVEIFLGAQKINSTFFPGHTGGDSVVLIPDANTIFCGDLFWRKTLPNLIDATTSAWVQTLSKFMEGSPGTAITFVPGHGDVGTLDDVRDFRGYLINLRSWVAAALKDGKTGDALVNAVMPSLKEKYGSWDFFNDFAKSNILDMAAEIQGQKKIPKIE